MSRQTEKVRTVLAKLEKCIGGRLVGAYATESALVWRFDIQTLADGIYYIYIVNRYDTTATVSVPGMEWVMVVRSTVSSSEETPSGSFTLLDLTSRVPAVTGMDMTLLCIYSDPGPVKNSYITRLTFNLPEGAFLHLSFYPCLAAMEAEIVAPVESKLAKVIDKQKGDRPIYQPGTNTVQ